MNKKIVLLLISCGVMFASSFDIELKKDSWNLVGTSEDLNISKLSLGADELLWSYKNGKWYTNKTTQQYTKIDTIEANDAFWVYATQERNITIEDTTNQLTILNTGWSMFSPSNSYTLSNDINSTIIPTIWGYNDNNWTIWDPSNLVDINNTYQEKNSILQGKGVWAYSYEQSIPKIIKLSSDSIENIWNLSFEIDTSVDYTDLDIGVKFLKNESDGTPDIGKFIYDDISLKNGILSSPDALYIEGNGDSASGVDLYNTSYDPDNLRVNSIELVGNTLNLKLGYLMKNQTKVTESTFTVATNYDIVITSNQPIIKNADKIVTGFSIETLNKTVGFSKTKGIEVELQIK